MDELAHLLPARRGHFRFESGHHGSLWLDLELLCLHPQRLRPICDRLAAALAPHAVEVVCGPLVEGAFVALLVASALGLPFTYADRRSDPRAGGLFPVRYELPRPLRPIVSGKRVAIVNDVINAGSAVRGTLLDLREQGAEVIVIGTLAVLGDAAAHLARDAAVELETLARWPNDLWPPSACPLCAAGAPLVDPTVTDA
jgi:orotate phosphoribosyltransferase